MLHRSLWIVCAVALAHGLFLHLVSELGLDGGVERTRTAIAGWDSARHDRTFTRFPDAPTFVPEVIRTPEVPVVRRRHLPDLRAGQLPVALAQTGLFIGICLLVYSTARRIVSEQTAWWIALVTALFPPIPYFGALVMTEVWTTLLLTLAMWLLIRALDDRGVGRFALVGVVTGLTALSRPAFVLLPIALAGGRRRRAAARPRGRASGGAPVGGATRHLRAHHAAVVRVQTTGPGRVHAVARRRRRPWHLGRIVAGAMVRTPCRTS